MIQQILLIACGLSTSTLFSYIYYCLKNNNNDEKIEIMDVRQELFNIRRIEQSEKERKF